MPADNSMMSSILMIALMAVAFWLLLIRPNQRRQKQQQELIAQLAPGSRVMTNSGVLATIREVGERTMVLEISPGVEMTVLKQAVLRTVTADEEEFEYDEDETDLDELDVHQEFVGDTFDPERPNESGAATS